MNPQLNIIKTSLQWRVIGSLLLVLILLASTLGNPMNTLAKKKGVRVGLVFQTGPVVYNDISFQGLMLAEERLGIDERVYIRVDDDYEAALRQCVADGNTLCLSVGFLTIDAAVIVAAENPQVAFGVIDAGYDFRRLPNLRYMGFNERQAGYLAGLVAGKMTITDKLGIVGGIEIPPVINFAEGFRNAAQCINPDAEVSIEYAGSFDDPAAGASLAEEMIINGGADVVFNVAGATGNGAISKATELGAYAVGVDTDQYITYFLREGIPYNHLVLTSAMKNLDVAVFSTVEDFVNGRFTPGIKMYDLSNNGVGIAPFHELSEIVSPAVGQLVKTTQAKIINGEVDINDSCR